MPNYKNGKIYKIEDLSGQHLPYYGSTVQKYISNRITTHRKKAQGDVRECASAAIIAAGNYRYSLVENFPCNTKEELLVREQYYIDNFPCINKQNAVPSDADKAEWLEKRKIWRKTTRLQDRYDCFCGLKQLNKDNRSAHNKSQRHKDAVESLVEWFKDLPSV